MAPIKFEDNIKDTLEKRTIQPSTDAWSALSNRLDAYDKKKKSPLFWWFGIAASVAGIVFITTTYVNNSNVITITPTIVNTQTNEDKEDKQNIKLNNQTDKVAVENVNTSAIKTPTNTTISDEYVKSTDSEKRLKRALPAKEAVAQTQETRIENTPTNNVRETNQKELKSAQVNFEERKIKEAVAQIKSLKESQNGATDSDIEDLLKKAEKDIISNRVIKETTKVVDANSLLQDVETDLEQSFRDKVFKALQSGYESVRTTVAERNN